MTQPTAGVYAIRNTVTGQLYVGSSVDVDQRWRAHLANFAGGRQPKRMQLDWQVYGTAAFVFDLLEVVAPDETVLQAAEQRWLDSFEKDGLYNRLRKVSRKGCRKKDRSGPAGTGKFVAHIAAHKAPDEPDAQFARRLGISRSHWRHIQAGRREVGKRLAGRVMAIWPELGPLWLIEVQGTNGTPDVQADTEKAERSA